MARDARLARINNRLATIVHTRWFRIAFWGALGLFIAAVIFGIRLQWLRHEWTWYFRAYAMFPLMAGTFAWVAFIVRTPSGMTAYRTIMKSTKGPWNKFSQAFWLAAGVLLLPGFIALTSYVFPAWAAYFFSHDPWSAAYRVGEVQARSGPIWTRYYEAYLQGLEPNGNAVLPLRASIVDNNAVRPGVHVCLRGRSSFFGAIVTDIANADACGKSKGSVLSNL